MITHTTHTIIDDSGYNKGWHRGTWHFNIGLGGILLCRQWTCSLEETGEAAESFWRPHWPLWSGHPQGEYAEDSEYGLPSIPRACKDVGRGVWEADNGDMADLSGATEKVGTMFAVWNWVHSGVTAYISSEPDWCGFGGPGAVTLPPWWRGPNLPQVIPKKSVVVPVPSRGLSGWGFKLDQPKGSLYALLCAGHNCDPGEG